jgi:hypothetical protein
MVIRNVLDITQENARISIATVCSLKELIMFRLWCPHGKGSAQSSPTSSDTQLFSICQRVAGDNRSLAPLYRGVATTQENAPNHDDLCSNDAFAACHSGLVESDY